jgi:hypothetical protein
MIELGAKFPISQIMPMLQPGKVLDINGTIIKKTKTMRMIGAKGATCAICGRTASYFQYRKMGNSTYPSFVLFFDHTSKRGFPAFMTKDHIHPQSLGGVNDMENLQPTCNVCNNAKGNKLQFSPPSEIMFSHNGEPNWLAKLLHMTCIKRHLQKKRTNMTVSTALKVQQEIRNEARRAIRRQWTVIDEETFGAAWAHLFNQLSSPENLKLRLIDVL